MDDCGGEKTGSRLKQVSRNLAKEAFITVLLDVIAEEIKKGKERAQRRKMAVATTNSSSGLIFDVCFDVGPAGDSIARIGATGVQRHLLRFLIVNFFA
ncbi:hypothetical protein Ancab_011515 [Ancistrocladus abbreviatus]